MSLAFKPDETPEYATKTEIHWMLKVSYGKIAEYIRTGKLAVHLIDGKIQINVEEAKRVLIKPRNDLFT
jgi:predicted site-specific integrase-resolvase